MQRAMYDSRPASIEAVGNGCFLYRWDIKEETIETTLDDLDAFESGRDIEQEISEAEDYGI